MPPRSARCGSKPMRLGAGRAAPRALLYLLPKWSSSMKHVLAFLLAAVATGTSLLADEPTTSAAETKPQVQKSTFLISGLHCPPCTSTVERSLKGVKGVRSAKVDW